MQQHNKTQWRINWNIGRQHFRFLGCRTETMRELIENDGSYKTTNAPF